MAKKVEFPKPPPLPTNQMTQLEEQVAELRKRLTTLETICVESGVTTRQEIIRRNG